jgi:hypothetical protein
MKPYFTELSKSQENIRKMKNYIENLEGNSDCYDK